MNQELQKLKELKDDIVGVEMQLALLQSDLMAIEKDVAFLEDLKTILEENIIVLKSDNIVAIASEFKKATEELKTVKENLIFYREMTLKVNSKYDKYLLLQKSMVEEYKVMKRLIDNRKVILIFDPSKRKK